MKTLSNELKNAIPPMPQSFENRIAETLKNLPVNAGLEKGMPIPRHARRLKKRSLAILIAAATALLAGTALAASYLLKMSGSKVGYFQHADSPDIAAQQDYFERQSDAVDEPLISDTEGGIEFLINNIAINDKTVTVFYSASRKEPLPAGIEALRGLIPRTTVAIGNDAVQSSYDSDRTVRRIGANTITWMDNYWMENGVPVNCTLTVSAEEVFGVSVNRSLDFEVDLSEVVANTRYALSGQTIHFEGSHDESNGELFWTHDVTISEVRIGKNDGVAVLVEPTPEDVRAEQQKLNAWQQARAKAMVEIPGGFASLSQAEIEAWEAAYDKVHPMPEETLGYSVPDYCAFVDFAILNDRGESLNVRCDGINGGGESAENELYFQPDFETKSLTFVPILGSGERVEKEIHFENQLNVPVEMYDGLTVTLTEVIKDQEKNEITLRYKEEGVQSIWRYAQCRFTDANGRQITDTGSTRSPDAPFRDNVTGIITNTVTFLDGYDLDQIHGALFEYSVPNIAYDKAVTVYFP